MLILPLELTICSSNQTIMNYGVWKRGIVEHGVNAHQICIFYIDIDEHVCDGFKHPTKTYL